MSLPTPRTNNRPRPKDFALNNRNSTLNITLDPSVNIKSNINNDGASIRSTSSFLEPLHERATSFIPTSRAMFWLTVSQISSFLISSFFLILVVGWALLADLSARLPRVLRPVKPATFPWDDATRWKQEKVVKEVQYYARGVGLDIIDEEVETVDGYLLRMHRVVNPREHNIPGQRGKFPILILHGLFQSSGAFITSEERSLAFWLAQRGDYQVFLGNTRGVFDMGHRTLDRNDPRFWDWTIRDQAAYDFPAMVEWVCATTGYDKIAFIGHSQGNGIAFISLSCGLCPEIGERLSCFIALAPAVFAGPLTHGFPFTTLGKLNWKQWKRIFGVLDFIPLMRWSYNHVPAKIFSAVGYVMFAFLFSWTDTNWLHRRKTKMFRFTPTPVSSASIFWWCGKGGFAEQKCIMDEDVPQWFDERFPPLSIFYGGRDYLVLTEPLLSRINEREPDVELIRVERLELSEHCDFYWAADALEWCFEAFVEDIEKTRPREGNLLDDGPLDNNTL